MRWTTGSCSARPRGLPFDPVDAGRGAPVWDVPPGRTCSFAGRPKAPLAAAVTIFRPSLLTDMSINAADAATLIVNSLPLIAHSPAPSMDDSMLNPADSTAFSTAARTSSTFAVVGFGSGCRVGSGSRATAGAADPITTGGLIGVGAIRGVALGASGAASIRGVPLRAVSAANGDTNGRAAALGSVFFGSGANDSFLSGVPGLAGSTPLSNCSMGSNRCACAIFNNPSSR